MDLLKEKHWGILKGLHLELSSLLEYQKEHCWGKSFHWVTH